jgi:hypothetical protein
MNLLGDLLDGFCETFPDCTMRRVVCRSPLFVPGNYSGKLVSELCHKLDRIFAFDFFHLLVPPPFPNYSASEAGCIPSPGATGNILLFLWAVAKHVKSQSSPSQANTSQQLNDRFFTSINICDGAHMRLQAFSARLLGISLLTVIIFFFH